MRILIDYRPALVERTGVGEYAHEMAQALLSLLPSDDKLTLFSSSWKHRLEPDRVPGAAIVDARIPVRILNLAWHRFERPVVETLAGPVDVAHSMHPLLMPARAAAQLVTIYDLFFLHDSAGTASEIRRDYPALSAIHARRADAVVVISEYTAREAVSKLGVAPERIVLCPPGAPSWSPRAGPNSSGPILYIGSPERRKNVPGLLRAYARLRAQAARRTGAGPGRSSARFAVPRSWRRSPGRRSTLTSVISGTSPTRSVSGSIASASMLVVPSLDEGFGMPVVEAMTIGVPVVAANRGALPEVSGDAAQLVDPLDDEEMAEAMRRILEDPAATQAAVERGYRRARQYSWRTSAETLLQAYRQVHERRRTTA